MTQAGGLEECAWPWVPRQAGTKSHFFQGDKERVGTLKPPSGLTGSLFIPQVPFSHRLGAAPAAASPGWHLVPTGQAKATGVRDARGLRCARRAETTVSPPGPTTAQLGSPGTLAWERGPQPGYSLAQARPLPGMVAGSPLRPCSPSGEAGGTNQPPGVA